MLLDYHLLILDNGLCFLQAAVKMSDSEDYFTTCQGEEVTKAILRLKERGDPFARCIYGVKTVKNTFGPPSKDLRD